MGANYLVFLQVTFAFGGIIPGLYMKTLAERRRSFSTQVGSRYLCLAFFSLLLTDLGLSPLSYLSLLGIGVCIGFINVLLQTYLVEILPSHIQHQVFCNIENVILITRMISFLIVGFFLTSLAPALHYSLSAALLISTAAWLFYYRRTLDYV